MVLDGETVILEAYIDITERQRLETQLQQAQRMQAVGTLAGGIAHDFNNLLTAILGFTDLALQAVGRELPAGRYLEEVRVAGSRAQDIVQQMLTFSRQTQSQRSPIQLRPLIEEVVSLLSASLHNSITMPPIVDPGAGFVLADATQIHQVLMNLCINAAHAMRDAGGVVEVTLDAVNLTSDDPLVPVVLQAGAYVRLRVQDTGQGMPPEVMEHIFEPFYTTKDTGEGTGLGLAVAHGIVTQHEGSITVESAPGQGATFTIHLPSIADPEAEPEGDE
jgi:signal transduction histidine kinase